MIRLLASLLLVTSLPVMAQIYVYTDADGNPAYTSQQPPAGVSYQLVGLPPTNTVAAPVVPTDAAPAANYTAPPPAPNDQQQDSQQVSHDDNDLNDGDVYDGTDYDNDYNQARPAAVDAAVPGHVEDDAGHMGEGHEGGGRR